MVFFNASTRELTAKIVYYGPGLGGKTTNLKVLHERLEPRTAGDLVALSTESDRTIYFDLLPVELGDIKGYRIRFQLTTVPGQTAYNETRRVVLKGADGIVFVADSQWTLLPKNLESWQSLRENLAANVLALALERDQKKRGQRHDLPGDEEQNAVSRHGDHRHRGNQKVEEEKCRRESPLPDGGAQVPSAVDRRQSRHEKDADEEERGQWVERDVKLSHRQRPRHFERALLTAEQGRKRCYRTERAREGSSDGPDREGGSIRASDQRCGDPTGEKKSDRKQD